MIDFESVHGGARIGDSDSEQRTEKLQHFLQRLNSDEKLLAIVIGWF